MKLFETETARGTKYRVSVDEMYSGALKLSGRIELGKHVFVKTTLGSSPAKWEVYSVKKGMETFLGYAGEATTALLEDRLAEAGRKFGWSRSKADSLDSARVR